MNTIHSHFTEMYQVASSLHACVHTHTHTKIHHNLMYTYMAFWLAELVEDSGMDYSLHLFCACTSAGLRVLCLGVRL